MALLETVSTAMAFLETVDQISEAMDNKKNYCWSIYQPIQGLRYCGSQNLMTKARELWFDNTKMVYQLSGK